MQHTIGAAVAALLIAGALPLGAQTTLTIDAAVESALRNNLSLQRTKLSADAKKRASDRSWNSLIPNVAAAGSAAKSNSGTGAAGDWIPSGSFSASVSLSPALVSAMKQAAVDWESGVIDYESAKKSLELSTRKAFNQLLLYSAQIEVYERKAETARSQYEQTSAKARVGQASELDVLSAQVEWEKLKPNLASARVSYESALDSFKLSIGLPVDAGISLAGTLETGTTAEAIAKLERNGDPEDVTAYRKALQLAEAQKKTASDKARMPYLSLSFSASPTYAADEWTDKGSFSASLGLDLDSFLPWSSAQETLDQYDDAIKSWTSRIAEARLSSDATVRQLRRSIEKSFSSIQALTLNVRLAEKSYAMYEEAFRKGTSDLQSLKDAGDALAEARSSVLQERYTLLNAILDLESELNVPFGTVGRN